MRLRWLPQAADDLESIYEYLLENNPAFADSTVTRLYEGIRSLREMPYRGRPRSLPGVRDLIFFDLPYIVTYRVTSEAIEILYIRHSARKPLPR